MYVGKALGSTAIEAGRYLSAWSADVQKKAPKNIEKDENFSLFTIMAKLERTTSHCFNFESVSDTMLDGKWEDSKGVFKWEKSY